MVHAILTFIVTAETFHYFITLLDTLEGNAFETTKFHLQRENMQNFHYIRRGGVLHVYSVCVFVLLKICILETCLSSNLKNSSLVRDHYVWIICFEMIKSFSWSRDNSIRYNTVSGAMVCLNYTKVCSNGTFNILSMLTKCSLPVALYAGKDYAP